MKKKKENDIEKLIKSIEKIPSSISESEDLIGDMETFLIDNFHHLDYIDIDKILNYVETHILKDKLK